MSALRWREPNCVPHASGCEEPQFGQEKRAKILGFQFELGSWWWATKRPDQDRRLVL